MIFIAEFFQFQIADLGSEQKMADFAVKVGESEEKCAILVQESPVLGAVSPLNWPVLDFK